MQLQHFLSWNKANIKYSCKSQLYNNEKRGFHNKVDARLFNEKKNFMF